jgi:hypothetical protein
VLAQPAGLARQHPWQRRSHAVNAFRRISLVTLSLAVLILAQASAASAASVNVEVENLRGPLANAWFSAVDASGCMTTDAFVSATDTTDQHLPGVGVATAIAAVSIFSYDACTGETLLDAVGQREDLGADAFLFSKQLDFAALDTTVTLTDVSTGDTFDVLVDMNWTGTSDITRQHSNTNDVLPGCHVLNRWKGSGRQATAAGVVSRGSINFTSAESDLAEIGYVIDGFEVMGCY